MKYAQTRRSPPGTETPASHSLDALDQRPGARRHDLERPADLLGQRRLRRLGVGGVTLFHFFPDWFYRVLGLEHGLAVGMAYHFTFMWFFAINGFCYVLYTFLSGEWRHLLPNRHTPREAWHVVLHDLKLRKAPLPPAKFNGAQRLAYTGVILMGAGSLLTGLAIYKPTQLAWLTNLLGGYAWARAEHFALTIGYVLFFRHSHGPGDPGRLEQFPGDGHRLRAGAGGGGESCLSRRTGRR